MPSDKSTVATKADFVPTVVGGTDRERSIASSAPRAHDGTSQQPRPEVHPEALNVLIEVPETPREFPTPIGDCEGSLKFKESKN